MSKLIKLVLLTLGCVFLVWALNNVELSSVFDLLKKLGWGFIIILIIYSGVTWLDAFSWKYNFRPDETLSFSNWDLWRIRQIGEAYNIIIPFATLGGEPIKAHLLKNNHGLAMKQAIAVSDASYTPASFSSPLYNMN